MEIIKKKNGQRELDLLSVFFLLLRKAWLIAIAALLGSVISVAYTKMFVPPSFEASVALYVSNTTEGEGTEIVPVTLSDLSASMMLAKTCGTILKDEDTLEMVAQLSGLDYSTERLQEMMQVEVIEDTKIMYVIVTAEDPNEAAIIADSVGEVIPAVMKKIEPTVSVRVLNPAKVPQKKSAPSLSQAVIMGFVAGALVAVIILVARAILVTGVMKARQLATLGLPVLAVLPEGLERAKNNLVYSLPGSASKSILFIDFPPIADKPFTAVEIADTMAKDGYRVLLIDCNLKTPCLIKALGLKKKPGVSDILVGKLQPEAAIRAYNKNLDLITAGTPSMNPDNLLMSEEMGEMLDVLGSGYDFILILSSAEKDDQVAASLASRVSGTVLVTKRKATKTDALQDYLVRLESYGAHVLGAVFDTGEKK